MSKRECVERWTIERRQTYAREILDDPTLELEVVCAALLMAIFADEHGRLEEPKWKALYEQLFQREDEDDEH